jgi:PTS system nitrogen regulatory IIA component
MEIADLVEPEAVLLDLDAPTKKQALTELARLAARVLGADDEGAAREIFEVLLERERLGTTGVGGGIAIPHGKLKGITRLRGLFARMAAPIEFESIDDRKVDLVFVLLAPEGAGADHLKALARVSRLLRERAVCDRLRAAVTAAELHAALVEAPANNAA